MLFYLSRVDFDKEISWVYINIYPFKLEGPNYDADFGGQKIKISVTFWKNYI